jgi:predicted nucleotidyltransferase
MSSFDEVRPYRERCAHRREELSLALERVVDYARRTPEIARVVVFGSYARDRVSPWSDLDLVVVRDDGPDDLVDDLYRACGIPGDVIGVVTADFPARLETTPFGRTILAEGHVVYARSA